MFRFKSPVYLGKKEVEEVLKYGCLLNAFRRGKFGISGYRVNKPWGYEVWLEICQWYCLKLIHMKPGCRCSLQYHTTKVESNYVIQGSAMVLLSDGPSRRMKKPEGLRLLGAATLLGNEDAIAFEPKLIKRVFKAGEGWSVYAGQIHRVIAGPKGYTALEVSSPHLNDCIRLQDDARRPSGKIEQEHIRQVEKRHVKSII